MFARCLKYIWIFLLLKWNSFWKLPNMAVGFFFGLLMHVLSSYVLFESCEVLKCQFWIPLCWICLLFSYNNFENWNFMHVFYDLLFCYCLYGNVVCVNQKDLVLRLEMHFLGLVVANAFLSKIWVSVFHVLPKNITLDLWFGSILVPFFTLNTLLDFIN